MSLLDEEDSLIISPKERVKTDMLCFHFSWPIFFAVFQIFIFVIVYGQDFSIFHPPDNNGLRCGINNARFAKGFNDYKNNTILLHNGVCSKSCNGAKFLSYCIPKNKTLLKRSSLPFKASYDFIQYKKFAIISIISFIIISIPVYFVIIKEISIISIILMVFISVLCAGSAIYEFYSKNYIFGIILCIVGCIYLLFFLFLRSRINSIKPILVTSLSLILQNKSLFVIPFLIMFSVFIIAMVSIFGFIFSKGVSEPIPIVNGLQQKQHKSLTLTTAMFPVLGIWLAEFMISWARSAIALIISSSYFQKHTPTITEALALMAHFHSGTLFFGSFVIFCLEQMSNFFNFLRQTMKETKSPFVKFTCKCTLNICFCCVQFFGEVNRLSTVYTAVKGVSFWDGCKKAANALKIQSVLSIELIIHHLFLGIRLLLSFASLVAVFIYQQQLALYFPLIPILWIPMTVYIALASIDVTFTASSDTILLCLCEDAKTDGFHGPKDLEGIVNWLKEHVVQETFKE